MWTEEDRTRYDRSQLRYPSDLTDEEWGHVKSMIPPAKRGGRRREVDERAVVNGIMYVLSTGCQWRHVPTDLPALRQMPRATGARASPTACVIDSQSVKSAEKGGRTSTRVGTMQGRRSKARNRISSSTPQVCYSTP
jgi:transposase